MMISTSIQNALPHLLDCSDLSDKEMCELHKLIYDAHCHVHLDSDQRQLEVASDYLKQLAGSALMSTRPDDWEQALHLSSQIQSTRCLLGIHPWFAHLYTENLSWLEDLRGKLLTHPDCAVGEIGLDKQWSTPETGQVEWSAQLRVFHFQLSLAAELNRPVSIHCVRAQGDLYRLLSSAPSLPPKIYLHAFGGKSGTVEQLVRSKRFGDRLYFGFAACVNLRSTKVLESIAAVPDHRLLLESDRSKVTHSSPLEELIIMLKIYATVKGWRGGMTEAALRTKNNAEQFFESVPT